MILGAGRIRKMLEAVNEMKTKELELESVDA